MGPVHVLMVEDDPGDVALSRALMKEGKLSLELSVAEDGQAALDFLQRRAPYEDAKPVDLVILDLHLPKLDGFEVLRRIKADPKLKDLPVCVLTVSDRTQDQERARAAGACCFVTKPLDLSQFQKIVQQNPPLWLCIVRSSPSQR